MTEFKQRFRIVIFVILTFSFIVEGQNKIGDAELDYEIAFAKL